MTRITSEGRERLDIIFHLFQQIQNTYETPVSVSELSAATGIPSTNLYKWIYREVNPRQTSFEDAKQRLESYLAVRIMKVAAAHRRLPEKAQRTFAPKTPSTTAILINIAVSLSAGAAGAALVVFLL